MLASALILEAAQRNNEQRKVENRRRAEPEHGLMDDDLIAGIDLHILTGNVVPAARILAGRNVWIETVRRAIGLRMQIAGGKVNQPALNAFVAGALSVLELRRLRHGVEDDLVGGEHRVMLVVDQKRVVR